MSNEMNRMSWHSVLQKIKPAIIIQNTFKKNICLGFFSESHFYSHQLLCFLSSAYGQYGNHWSLMSFPLHAAVLSQPPFPILAVLLISHAVSSITVLTESLINHYCIVWYGGKASVLARLEIHKEAKKHVSPSLRYCAMLIDQALL